MSDQSRSWCRLLPVLLCVVFVGKAQAEWQELGRTEAFRIFVDAKTIVRHGTVAQVAQFIDFTSSQWIDAQRVVGSIMNLSEFDCAQPRFRILSSQAYSEQMLSGTLVADEKLVDPPWQNVEPGSAPDKVRQVACVKK